MLKNHNAWGLHLRQGSNPDHLHLLEMLTIQLLSIYKICNPCYDDKYVTQNRLVSTERSKIFVGNNKKLTIFRRSQNLEKIGNFFPRMLLFQHKTIETLLNWAIVRKIVLNFHLASRNCINTLSIDYKIGSKIK